MASEDMKISGFTSVNNFINGFSTGEHNTKTSWRDILRKTPLFELNTNLQAQASSYMPTASTGMQ